jgi:hypothetical protein
MNGLDGSGPRPLWVPGRKIFYLLSLLGLNVFDFALLNTAMWVR